MTAVATKRSEPEKRTRKRILTGDRPTGPLHLGHYVGTLAKTSARPAMTLLLAWHPWAVIRVISFVVIGVVLSAPLLSRIGKFRVDWTDARRLLAWGGAGLVLDILLKTLFAPAWQRLLLRIVGW